MSNPEVHWFMVKGKKFILKKNGPRVPWGNTLGTWKSMHERCKPNSASARYYAKRGISIDPTWSSYEKFLEDMGPRPSQRHTLDRIDNNKGYSKDNCRWATAKQQNNNKRNNRKFKIDGEWLTVSQIASKYRLAYGTVASWAKGENNLSDDTEVHRRLIATKFARKQRVGVGWAYRALFQGAA